MALNSEVFCNERDDREIEGAQGAFRGDSGVASLFWTLVRLKNAGKKILGNA